MESKEIPFESIKRSNEKVSNEYPAVGELSITQSRFNTLGKTMTNGSVVFLTKFRKLSFESKTLFALAFSTSVLIRKFIFVEI